MEYVFRKTLSLYFKVFQLRSILKWGLFDAEDANWRRLRHLLTPSFTSGKLKKVLN